jgi:hypothetical protein
MSALDASGAARPLFAMSILELNGVEKRYCGVPTAEPAAHEVAGSM